MTELDSYTYYKVMIVSEWGECPGALKFVEHLSQWRLVGMSGYCSSLWDVVEHKPAKFTLRITHVLRTQEAPGTAIEEPLPEGMAVRFFGVIWKNYDCSSQ